MLVFGTNLAILCKSLGLEIKKVSRYQLTSAITVTLYDFYNPTNLINVPVEYFFSHNAWFRIPGEWTSYYEDTVTVKVKGKKLTVPNAVWHKKLVKSSPDIFTYLLKQYHKNSKIYDLAYTIARLNKFELKAFLDKYAVIV